MGREWPGHTTGFCVRLGVMAACFMPSPSQIPSQTTPRGAGSRTRQPPQGPVPGHRGGAMESGIYRVRWVFRMLSIACVTGGPVE